MRYWFLWGSAIILVWLFNFILYPNFEFDLDQVVGTGLIGILGILLMWYLPNREEYVMLFG